MLKILSFDEEITLDYTSMPFDDSDDAQYKDIKLSEALYRFEDASIDDCLELADVLQEQGL